jgi:hypothetical protein
MRIRLPAAALTALLAIGGACEAFACKPSLPIAPRETPFLALLVHASAIVEGRVVEKRELPLAGSAKITYLEIEVRRVLGGESGSKMRIWSGIGLIDTCPTHNYLADVELGDEGIFAIRTISINQRVPFQVENDVRILIVTHAIARPNGEIRMLGFRHDNTCPFGCAYFETGRLDALREKIAALRRP